jgi:hypothetical protein
MKDLYFDACEELWAELDREPTDQEIDTAYRAKIESLIDRADNDRKRMREEGE